jgi:hypothetical protein
MIAAESTNRRFEEGDRFAGTEALLYNTFPDPSTPEP